MPRPEPKHWLPHLEKKQHSLQFPNQNVDSSSLKTFTFYFPETFLPVEKPSQLSSESSSTSQVCFHPNMYPNDKPWRSPGVWVSPNHQHQHCWVQFRNWFLRLCGLRRPILFLLDTSKYYNLIFTHLSKYKFVLWRFGSDFVVHTSWAKVSVLVITAVVLCPACPNPQSPPTHSFVADPSALQVPRPAECPIDQRPMRTPAVLLIATSHLLRNPEHPNLLKCICLSFPRCKWLSCHHTIKGEIYRQTCPSLCIKPYLTSRLLRNKDPAFLSDVTHYIIPLYHKVRFFLLCWVQHNYLQWNSAKCPVILVLLGSI